MGELREKNKNIAILPVAGVTVVGVTGVRSKRVTKQIHLSFLIINAEFENTFFVVKGLSLNIILGNDFLQRNKAGINFKEKVVELDGGDQSISCLLYTSIQSKIREIDEFNIQTNNDIYDKCTSIENNLSTGANTRFIEGTV